ncbi:unnamed protein product [Caenorhabditis bovis]|uniref:ZP domain-containing protein n=1 Tax=Caenorhabditis bovis TaxID=2654633 RepID=A0A8S1E9N5_9PELO|nr:unnamed protein product [Caenorhabditis bovis]
MRESQQPQRWSETLYAILNETNRTYTIIDKHGCSIDNEIMPTPEYDIVNNLIYTPSKAFRFATSNHVHFQCMISLCRRVDSKCRQQIPPRCRKSQKKRRALDTSELTIEQRLRRIQAIMNVENSTEIGEGLITSVAETLQVKEQKDYTIEKYESIIRTYQAWTSILCILNILLVVVTILITLRLLKNKYIMDIKDKTQAIFRRSPF